MPSITVAGKPGGRLPLARMCSGVSVARRALCRCSLDCTAGERKFENVVDPPVARSVAVTATRMWAASRIWSKSQWVSSVARIGVVSHRLVQLAMFR